MKRVTMICPCCNKRHPGDTRVCPVSGPDAPGGDTDRDALMEAAHWKCRLLESFWAFPPRSFTWTVALGAALIGACVGYFWGPVQQFFARDFGFPQRVLEHAVFIMGCYGAAYVWYTKLTDWESPNSVLHWVGVNIVGLGGAFMAGRFFWDRIQAYEAMTTLVADVGGGVAFGLLFAQLVINLPRKRGIERLFRKQGYRKFERWQDATRKAGIALDGGELARFAKAVHAKVAS